MGAEVFRCSHCLREFPVGKLAGSFGVEIRLCAGCDDEADSLFGEGDELGWIASFGYPDHYTPKELLDFLRLRS